MSANMEQLVITPTNRLASHCLTQWPVVMSLGQWVKSLWQALMLVQPVPRLIPPELRSLWWHDIIADDFDNSHIWPAASTVKQAIAAMRLVIEWEINDEQLQNYSEGNSACFCRWLNLYLAKINAQQSLDFYMQMTHLATHLNAIASFIPKNILCYAFDDMTPQTQTLIASLEQIGCNLEYQSPNPKQAKVFRYDAPDEQTERSQALAFASKHQPGNAQKQSPVTIVVPDLVSQRLAWANDCQDLFDPISSLQLGEKAKLIYNISGGDSLDQVPVTLAALEWLKALHSPIDWQSFARCVSTPFIVGGISSAPSRQAALHQQASQMENSKTSFLSYFWQQTLPLLAGDDPLIEAVAACQSNASSKQRLPLARWIPLWLTRLESLGWPGERIVTSQEYQAIIQWQQVMEGLLAADYHQDSWTAYEALTLVEQALGQAVFQPETQHDIVTTQVLGILEAAGQSVDTLWITGLSQHHWPPAPNPNPFLPLALQRILGLPHSTIERETDYAQRIFQTLLHSADTIVLSYAKKTQAGEQFPSPLLESIETLPYQGQTAHLSALNALSTYETSTWIEQAPGPLTTIKAQYPSSLLSHQSQCPFKAFATHRLDIKQPIENYLGLSPAVRGQMLHQVLQFHYQHPNPSSTILSKLVDDTIRTNTAHLPDFFQTIENERLLALVNAVIEADTVRDSFSFIGLEQRLGLTLGDIQLSMKVDRLDQDTHNQQWLIDYKTGAVKIEDWQGQRPFDVQMLLYAITTPQFPDVIAYYTVKPKGIKIIGLSKQETHQKGITALHEEWPALASQWQQLLNNLAQEFQSGHANIAPIDTNRCCQYCHLHSVCRIGIEEPAAC